jgi:hypothetical protein
MARENYLLFLRSLANTLFADTRLVFIRTVNRAVRRAIPAKRFLPNIFLLPSRTPDNPHAVSFNLRHGSG